MCTLTDRRLHCTQPPCRCVNYQAKVLGSAAFQCLGPPKPSSGFLNLGSRQPVMVSPAPRHPLLSSDWLDARPSVSKTARKSRLVCVLVQSDYVGSVKRLLGHCDAMRRGRRSSLKAQIRLLRAGGPKSRGKGGTAVSQSVHASH